MLRYVQRQPTVSINFWLTGNSNRAPHPMPVYTTAKSSVIGLTRGLAAELGESRIRINVITPGWVMTERQIQKWLTPEGELEIKRNQVLPDKVRPEDVAPMALFLASDDARACSAQEYIVDAGWL